MEALKDKRETSWVRVAVIGDEKSGKTNLITRLVQNQYLGPKARGEPLPPLKFEGPLEEEQSPEHFREILNLSIHDTSSSVLAGQDKYSKSELAAKVAASAAGEGDPIWEQTDGLLYNVDVIVVCFDAKSKEEETRSLKKTAEILAKLRDTPIINDKPVLLVGTKTDCRKDEQGENGTGQIQSQAHQLLATFPNVEVCVHCSARSGFHGAHCWNVIPAFVRARVSCCRTHLHALAAYG